MNLTNVRGGKELAELLRALPVKLENNIMRGALRAGAKVILVEAKANAPVDDGDLKDSLRISTKSKRGEVKATVKVGNKKVYYAKFIEFGTAAHKITARGTGLRFGSFFGKSVNHPGVLAKPFMRPALDSRSSQAVNEIRKYIGKRLTKQGLNVPDIAIGDEE
jgi:HK97 gp10 family phage protein